MDRFLPLKQNGCKLQIDGWVPRSFIIPVGELDIIFGPGDIRGVQYRAQRFFHQARSMAITYSSGIWQWILQGFKVIDLAASHTISPTNDRAFSEGQDFFNALFNSSQSFDQEILRAVGSCVVYNLQRKLRPEQIKNQSLIPLLTKIYKKSGADF